MEISPRRSMSLDLDTSVRSPVASSYPPTYGNCRADMYTMQGIELSPEAKIQKSYRMTSSLSVDSATRIVAAPKKENFFTSMFGALTSIVVERFGKVPSSFVSNFHNTLSVTVVPNEGIISQDFFKNLTRSCEQLASENKNNGIKEDPRIIEKLPNSMYEAKSPVSHIFTDNMEKLTLSGKGSLNFDCNTLNEREKSDNSNVTRMPDCPIISTEILNELDSRVVDTKDPRDNNDSICNENVSSMMRDLQFENIPAGLEVDIVTNDSTEATTSAEVSSSSGSAVPKTGEDQDQVEITDQTSCTAGWKTMWHKVVNEMFERFSTSRPVSPDSEVPTKKPNLAKPHRKTCGVAHGRGKGRGKSQLRRSGVSQSRHRKERTKQNIYSNIQDDLNSWEDNERYDESEDDDLSVNEQRNIDQQCSSSLTGRDSTNSSSLHYYTMVESLSFDVSLSARKRKQGIRKATSKCPSRVRYLPESPMEVENHDVPFTTGSDCSSTIGGYRPRLASESSVDSEDSYCIVFENGSESECTDYDEASEEKSDAASEEKSDAASEEASDAFSDDDLGNEEKTTPTVRFNLEPQVHTMIKWNYAYRAARRGPWEEMARDRERFRGRIYRIERVLNPILSVRHRNRIWRKRFNSDEESGQRVQNFLIQTLS